MAGFGIQKRGTSPLLVKRKGFDVGGDVEEASDPIEKRKKPLPSLEEKEKPKTFTEGVKDGVKKLVRAPLEIAKDVAKGVEEGTKKLKDQVGFEKKKSKSEELEDELGIKRKEKAKGGSVKDTHVTKDGRVAKKGLYYYMNRAKKLGKSKPGKGTVSDKALKASAKTAKK
jgi:hypothetical protein